MRFQSWISNGQWIARGLAASALLSACGQEAASDTTASATETTVSAYQALAASLQACSDKKADCEAAAAGDAAKLAACDAAAKGCEDRTKGASDNARDHLCKDAEACVKGHRGSRDDDAGPGDGRPDVHDCVGRHAPAAPGCLSDLFACLDKTGVRESNASTQLDAATRDAIVACVQAAHPCIVNDMSSRGGRPGGSRPHGAAGGPGFPGASAGRPGRDAAGSDGDDDDQDEAGRGGRVPGFPGFSGAGGGRTRGPRGPRGAGEAGSEAGAGGN